MTTLSELSTEIEKLIIDKPITKINICVLVVLGIVVLVGIWKEIKS
jgi:hypothetical protein